MINILLLTKRIRIACSTIFKKWGLQVTFPVSYNLHTYVTACIHTCTTCRVHSHYKLIKHATSVYIICEQLRCHQLLVHTLACSEYPIRVVRALFHTRVLFKFKSSCTVHAVSDWLRTFLHPRCFSLAYKL